MKPLGNRVVVKIIKKENQTESGIFIPGSKNMLEGEVLFKGPDATAVEIGNTVRFLEHAGIDIVYESQSCRFLKEDTEIECIL